VETRKIQESFPLPFEESGDSLLSTTTLEPMSLHKSIPVPSAGLFALVTLTITLILYFALVNQEDFHLIAVLIINVSDTIINLLMAFAIIIGFFQVRQVALAPDVMKA
jgi:hypothetical protein